MAITELGRRGGGGWTFERARHTQLDRAVAERYLTVLLRYELAYGSERLDFPRQQIAGPHLRAAFAEGLRDGAADAARGAGDDDPPVRKLDVHGPIYRNASWAVSRRLKMTAVETMAAAIR